MKNSTLILLALILITFVINGCQKSDLASVPKNKLAASSLSSSSGGLHLTASSSRVGQNYPDTLTLTGTSHSDSVHWFVTPATISPIQKTSSRYILSFNAAGTYRVKAVVNGADSVSTTVTVTDSVYTSLSYHSVPLTNDIIKLTPHFHNGNSADSTYLYFTAQTTNGYACSNSYLEYSNFLTSTKNFIINFDSVQTPDANHCNGGNPTLWASIYFTQYGNYVSNDATYPLKVTMNGMTYTGNIIFSSTTVTFDWNYTSGVVFTSKSINR
jgi:hypothetical protein